MASDGGLPLYIWFPLILSSIIVRPAVLCFISFYDKWSVSNVTFTMRHTWTKVSCYVYLSQTSNAVLLFRDMIYGLSLLWYSVEPLQVAVCFWLVRWVGMMYWIWPFLSTEVSMVEPCHTGAENMAGQPLVVRSFFPEGCKRSVASYVPQSV